MSETESWLERYEVNHRDLAWPWIYWAAIPMVVGLLPFVMGIAFVHMWLPGSGFSAVRVSLGLLLAGIIGLWLGHRHKRRFSAIIADLQTIMIGPAWLLSVLYKRLGIPC